MAFKSMKELIALLLCFFRRKVVRFLLATLRRLRRLRCPESRERAASLLLIILWQAYKLNRVHFAWFLRCVMQAHAEPILKIIDSVLVSDGCIDSLKLKMVRAVKMMLILLQRVACQFLSCMSTSTTGSLIDSCPVPEQIIEHIAGQGAIIVKATFASLRCLRTLVRSASAPIDLLTRPPLSALDFLPPPEVTGEAWFNRWLSQSCQHRRMTDPRKIRRQP